LVSFGGSGSTFGFSKIFGEQPPRTTVWPGLVVPVKKGLVSSGLALWYVVKKIGARSIKSGHNNLVMPSLACPLITRHSIL